MEAAGSVVVVPRPGNREGAEQQGSRPHSEPIPLKNRMAMYQAAVSKQDAQGFSSGVLEEAEVCSLPGGLANIRRRFESEELSSTHTATQFHYTHRSVQEVSNSSELSARCGIRREEAQQDERISHDLRVHHGEASSVQNHHGDEEEYYPKLSTKELAQHFEKTIEEAAPSKKIKIRVPKSEMCTVCRKRVYPMEGLIADKKKFHKSCFSCEHCNNKLSLGNYVSLHGHLYCSPHYKQLFKSKGNFGEGFGQGSQKELLNARDLRNADGLEWRHSLSQSSVSSLSDMFEKESSKLNEKTDQTPKNSNKVSVVWPPQTDSPKKPFTMDKDIQLAKPVWPPKSESSKSPKHQRRKVSQRTTLHE